MVKISNGINKTDEQLFQIIYEKFLEKGNNYMSIEDISEEIKPLSLSREELFESIEILGNYGLIIPNLSYNRTGGFIQINGNGFEKYARSYREDYYSLFEIIPDKIVNGKLLTSKDIAENLQKPLWIVNLVLDNFIQNGFIKCQMTLDMNIHILELAPQFARTFRKK